MLRFVLAGPKGVGKSSIFSKLSPQVSVMSKTGINQTIPIPPSLFSIVTLDFPSTTFSSLTQRDSIPQVLTNSHGIIFVIKDKNFENLREFYSLLQNCEIAPRLFVLFHQFDKLEKESQIEALSSIEHLAEEINLPKENIFKTSLFDGSLSTAFSHIISTLIPNFATLQSIINSISSSISASRVILCDASTFLPICDTAPDRSEQMQPIFDYFLRLYPKKKHLKTISFEANNTIVVFTSISQTVSIFVTVSISGVTPDSIMFNIQRAQPFIENLIQIDL